MRGPLPEITITDRQTAAKIIADPALYYEMKWLVSIGSLTGPVEGWSKVSSKRKLRLTFDDMDHPFRSHYKLPTEKDVRRIILFARKAQEGPILVHCAAGQSRSAAAAYLMLAVRLGEGREGETATRLHQLVAEASGKLLRPPALPIHPNRLLVWIGDWMLGRKGKLWEALVKTMESDYNRGFDPRMSGY